MKRIIMFEHAGSRNHGCEAIVRSTVSILGNHDYYLETKDADGDKEYGIEKLVNLLQLDSGIVEQNSLKGMLMRVKARLNTHLDYDTLECLYRNKSLTSNCACALSIGGDNYCYNGIIHSMRDKLNAFKAKEVPVVLWGCSIDKEKLDKRVIEDLKKYDIITARESLTVNYLYDIGIKNEVVPCSDPAFTLDTEPVKWQESILNSEEIIGINVSDFMKFYNAYPEATYRNFYNLIDYIINKTNYTVVLIPHVTHEENNDRIPIEKLASEFNSSRILTVNEDFNCMQLKYIISKCRMFVGCRTHSTIAAYSTCVPTLVVGYSTKARGICRDIFGSDDDLLIDARKFETDYDLTNKFAAFSERENELRNHLKEVMPNYIQKAYAAKNAVLDLV